MIPILFDTDIGNDIDDAVALAYLLQQPACELVGITTVTGDTRKRAALAEVLCRVAGRDDIPIRAGLTGPLLHGRGQPEVPQYAAIAHEPHRDYARAGADAVLFLRDQIRARPGELTLLATGPMTNLGALFALDPEAVTLLKEIVLMCGVFLSPDPSAREWNALVDPVAAGLTYHGGQGTLLSVGLDVTMQCQLDREICRQRFATNALLATVLQLAEVWFTHADRITFHDPLAAALIFEPTLCGVETGRITTVVEAGPREGQTLWEPAVDGPHRIAVTVDAARFFTHYFAVVEG